MLTSIGKYSKSFFVKLLVGIIILPFIFWGMGDVFRGGNQNVIATIDSNKISTKEFVQHVQRLNLDEKAQKNLGKTDLLERILSEYIGRKIVSLEIEKQGIKLTDSSLRDIIMNDKTFYKNNKFSRTEYEKFLLESGLTSPSFEKNLASEEKKRKLFSFLSGGALIPEFLIKKAYNKENQIKTIKYINLNKLYDKKEKNNEEVKKIYEENKDLFVEEFKSINFVELTPSILTGQNEFNELFFEKIDKIENEILDGSSIIEISQKNNLNFINTGEVNIKKFNRKKIRYDNISDNLFKKIFIINQVNLPELINIEDKYYIVEIAKINKVKRGLSDPEVKKSITSQLKIKNIIDNNKIIAKKIGEKSFNYEKMKEYSKTNSLEIKDATLKNLKDNKIFNKGIIKEIFNSKDKTVNLITNSYLTKNFIVYIENTKKINLDVKSKDYDNYKLKAKRDMSNNIYNAFDQSLNAKYTIDINNKVLNRIKNSFQ
jgi:peptidyl-prolyl cis-trans isomerase D